MFLRLLAAMLATAAIAGDASIDRVRIGVSNYNLSNLTVGVAQTKDFFKQEGNPTRDHSHESQCGDDGFG